MVSSNLATAHDRKTFFDRLRTEAQYHLVIDGYTVDPFAIPHYDTFLLLDKSIKPIYKKMVALAEAIEEYEEKRDATSPVILTTIQTTMHDINHLLTHYKPGVRNFAEELDDAMEQINHFGKTMNFFLGTTNAEPNTNVIPARNEVSSIKFKAK